MTKRYAILGNSGSGKTTLASELASRLKTTALDLDTLFWEPGTVAVPRAAEKVRQELTAYVSARDSWIIEGCYGDLIRTVLDRQPELIFLNPGETVCLRHCMERPFEAHKYSTREEQDRMLDVLLRWVREYYTRTDDMSCAAHRLIFDAYTGPKRELTEPVPLGDAAAVTCALS